MDGAEDSFVKEEKKKGVGRSREGRLTPAVLYSANDYQLYQPVQALLCKNVSYISI